MNFATLRRRGADPVDAEPDVAVDYTTRIDDMPAVREARARTLRAVRAESDLIVERAKASRQGEVNNHRASLDDGLTHWQRVARREQLKDIDSREAPITREVAEAREVEAAARLEAASVIKPLHEARLQRLTAALDVEFERIRLGAVAALAAAFDEAVAAGVAVESDRCAVVPRWFAAEGPIEEWQRLRLFPSKS